METKESKEKKLKELSDKDLEKVTGGTPFHCAYPDEEDYVEKCEAKGGVIIDCSCSVTI